MYYPSLGGARGNLRTAVFGAPEKWRRALLFGSPN